MAESAGAVIPVSNIELIEARTESLVDVAGRKAGQAITPPTNKLSRRRNQILVTGPYQ
jgi:hypothetical protein